MSNGREGFHRSRYPSRIQRLKQFGESVQKRRWELDISQAHLGILVGLSQSEVSRLEQGQHLPDRETLDRLADALQLGSGERIDLLSLAGYVVHQEYGALSENQRSQKRNESTAEVPVDLLLTAYRDYIARIRQATIRGDPQDAEDMVGFLVGEVRKLTSTSTSKIPRGPFLVLLAQALFQQIEIIAEISPPEVIYQSASPFLNELQSIERELNTGEVRGLSELSLGYIYYHMRHFEKSIESLSAGLDGLMSPDDQLQGLRALAIDWANLGREDEFGKVKKTALRLIDEGQYSSVERVCETLEGLGRAEGLLGMTKAFNTLEDARRIYSGMKSSNEKAPLRYVQLVRSQLEVIRELAETDTLFVESVGNEGLRLAKDHGYRRHQAQIETILNGLLNARTR